MVWCEMSCSDEKVSWPFLDDERLIYYFCLWFLCYIPNIIFVLIKAHDTACDSHNIQLLKYLTESC